MQNKENNKKILMAMVGAYLVYTGVSLIKDVMSGQPENATLFIVAGGIFAVLGLLTVVMNIKAYIAAVKEDIMIDPEEEEPFEEQEEEAVPVEKAPQDTVIITLSEAEELEPDVTAEDAEELEETEEAEGSKEMQDSEETEDSEETDESEKIEE